jgi:hypothetical protein
MTLRSYKTLSLGFNGRCYWKRWDKDYYGHLFNTQHHLIGLVGQKAATYLLLSYLK